MTPRAVVIPFGVPAEGRGLGLGLAALVHAFVHVEGGGVALAQLQSRGGQDEGGAAPSPVEAFVPPAAWRDITGQGDAPRNVSVVLTGAFEPPAEGHGTLRLLVFDARDGRTRARLDASVDDEGAGATLVNAFDQLWSGVGGEIGDLQGLRELGWDALESVLRAERCALHDPARGGPHDRLAAMLHLGRAIGDAPCARYPAERLAAIALETTAGQPIDAKLASAAARALERAVADAPTHVELVEALGALLLRLGRPREAEHRTQEAIAVAPTRARSYALLAQARQAQQDMDGALSALQAGLAKTRGDPLLHAELGAILAALGDLDAANVAWGKALARDPVNPAAFRNVAALALRSRDAAAAQALVDSALASPHSHPDVLRRAVQLVLVTEAEGLARASRLARLCERILERLPDDGEASLVLGRALLVLGEKQRARARLLHVEHASPGSAAAAEAHVVKLSIDEPGVQAELESVLRAAQCAAVESLADVAARARRLATLHGAWHGWLAAAVAERRRERWAAARGALEVALEAAPGATPLHLEMVRVLVFLEDPSGALSHAERALALEGDSSRALRAMADALLAAGRTVQAREVLNRVRTAQAGDDEDLRAIEARLSGGQQQAYSGLRGLLTRALKAWKG